MAVDVAVKRAIIYLRVSSTRQEDNASLPTQEQAARNYCGRHGYAIVDVCREIHTGQELWERDVLTDVRARIRRGEANVLLAYSVDRLARDPDHQAIVIGEAVHHGCDVEFVDEPPDDSPEAGLIRYVKAYAGKREALAIGERTMRGRRARALSGKIQGQGAWLFGYVYDHESGSRAIEPAQAAIVEEIFGLALTGHSDRWIARHLNARGVPTTSSTYRDLGRATVWTHSTVGSILTNPAYKGETYQLRWKWKRHGKSKLRPEDQWVKLPEGVTPAIVSPDVWATVQDQRARRGAGAATTRNERLPYLLRAMIRCGRCGYTYSPADTRNRRSYRCGSRHASRGACGMPCVSAERLEQEVWEQFLAWATPERIEAELRRLTQRNETPAADLASAKRALAKVVTQQERLVARLATAEEGDDFPWDIVERQIRQLQGERKRMETELARLEARHAQRLGQTAVLEHLAELIDELARVLRDAPFERKRAILEACETAIMLHEDRSWTATGVWRPSGQALQRGAGIGDLAASG